MSQEPDEKDVYVLKSVDGFWVYGSRVGGERWLWEYVPQVRRTSAASIVVGCLGVRSRLPVEAGGGNERVRLTEDETVAMSPLEACELAALVSAGEVAAASLEGVALREERYLDGVIYALWDGPRDSGLVGTVETYTDGRWFRFDTGEAVGLDAVDGRLWPAASMVSPPDGWLEQG